MVALCFARKCHTLMLLFFSVLRSLHLPSLASKLDTLMWMNIKHVFLTIVSGRVGTSPVRPHYPTPLHATWFPEHSRAVGVSHSPSTSWVPPLTSRAPPPAPLHHPHLFTFPPTPPKDATPDTIGMTAVAHDYSCVTTSAASHVAHQQGLEMSLAEVKSPATLLPLMGGSKREGIDEYAFSVPLHTPVQPPPILHAHNPQPLPPLPAEGLPPDPYAAHDAYLPAHEDAYYPLPPDPSPPGRAPSISAAKTKSKAKASAGKPALAQFLR